MTTEIAKTPWMRLCRIGSGYCFVRNNYYFCAEGLSEYFDIGNARQVKLVAYRRPGKWRYEVYLDLDECCVDIVSSEGVDVCVLDLETRDYLKETTLRDHRGPIYVECWVR